MRSVSILLLVTAATAAIPAAASAAPTIPVQGFLTGGSEDTPVEGEVTMTVRLYRTAADTEPPLYEVQQKVTVSLGLFTVWLGGDDKPLDAALFRANPTVHLGLVINGEELSPRLPLGTTAYAATAERAAVADTVPWSGVSGVPADLADGDQDTVPVRINVVTAVARETKLIELDVKQSFCALSQVKSFLATSKCVVEIVRKDGKDVWGLSATDANCSANCLTW